MCLFSLIYLCNNLFVSVWTHGYLFCTLGYYPIKLILLLNLFQLWPLDTVLGLLPSSSDVPPSFFFSISLFYGTTRCFKLILNIIFWPIHMINHFFKESWFILMENYIRNKDLDIRYACCHLLHLVHLCWPSKGIYVCTLTRVYVCVCIYIYIYIYIYIHTISTNTSIYNHPYIYQAKHEFILMSPTPTHYHMNNPNLTFSLFIL